MNPYQSRDKTFLRLFFSVFIFCGVLFSKPTSPLYPGAIVVYNSESWLPPNRNQEELNWLFGGQVIILSGDYVQAPSQPATFPGVVWHHYPGGEWGDERFILSSTGQNPSLDWFLATERWRTHGAGPFGPFDINGKQYEGPFLEYVSPELAPVPTLTISAFRDRYQRALPTTEIADVEAQVETLMRQFNRRSDSIRRDLILLETTRRLIERRVGKCIIKDCHSCHSEGNLPRTNKTNWIETYLDYLKDPNKHEGYGAVLSNLIRYPEDVILQGMLDIQTEVRLHLVNGKIVEDATFLRYYPFVGTYLSDADKAKIHRAVQTKFLDRLGERMGESFTHFMASMDVILTKDGKTKIIDLNPGTDSGYFKPWNDVITINRLMAFLTGQTTPLLRELDEIETLGIGSKEAIQKVRRLHRKMSYFIDADSEVEFWDRIMDGMRRGLLRNPNSTRLDQALKDLREMGMREGTLYTKFLHHVQDTQVNNRGNPLRLTRRQAIEWSQYINRHTIRFHTIVDSEGTLRGISHAGSVDHPSAVCGGLALLKP